MPKQWSKGQRRRSSRPAFWLVAATFVALLVPAGASATTTSVAGMFPEDFSGEDVEPQSELIMISDPAPLGPFLAETSTDDDLGALAQAAPTMGEAFTLHSRPGATRKILLDFDGEIVTSPYWNGGSSIDAAAYSRGSNQSDETFSATDLAEIQKIWAMVADDFASWDVDVTTQDPGAAGLAKNSSGDVEYGVRVVITPSSEWFSANKLGGVAYVDSFERSEYSPAWVFSANLSYGAAKPVAEAVSHEVGHTLGLRHDGITSTDGAGSTTTLEYYSGHGDWAPIMGLGYYRPITQWSRGEYPGATNHEDDLASIDGYLSRLGTGSGVIASGDSTSMHTLASGGRIDKHSLQISGGPVTVSVTKTHLEGNLLAELRIRNGSGHVVASATPISPTSSSLVAVLPLGIPAGTYTVEIPSIGWTPTGDPGFTSYASMGSYVLGIDAPGTTTTTTTTAPPTTVAPTTTAAPSTPVGPTPTTPATTTAPTTAPPTTQPPTTVPPTTEPPVARSAGDRLAAITPRRVLDTRQAGALVAGPLSAGRDTLITIDDVPDGAIAVVVNVTAVAPRDTGYFSLTPCGVAADVRTSSLNFAAGRNIANSVIVPVSRTGPTAGQICLFSSVPAHALLDLTGWIGASGELSLERLGSKRLVDTRTGTGITRRLSAGVRTPISLASVLGSETVGAVALNVTAIRPSSGGFLTIDDCSARRSPTSSLNFIAGEIRGNNGVFALGHGRELCVTSSAATHVTIDVTGEFGTGAGLTFVPSTSLERVLDTRNTGRLKAGGTTTFDINTASGANALTRSPVAASVNLTATHHDDDGYVTAWGCGERPTTSALNPSAGTATANGALVELSPGGTTCLFDATGGHLIVDLAGWWI